MSIPSTSPLSGVSQHETKLELNIKRRLLYFEIRFVRLLYDCLQQMPNTLALEKAVDAYKELDNQLHNGLTRSQCSTWEKSMEEHLGDLYQLRVRFTKNLYDHLKEWNAENLILLFKDIDDQLDDFVYKLNKGKDLDDRSRRNWEGNVNHFQEIFLAMFNEKILQSQWGGDYHKNIRKVEILSFYHSWEKILKRESESLFLENETLFSQLSRPSSFYLAYKIKRLLNVHKESYFRTYFHDSLTKRAAVHLSVKLLSRKSVNLPSLNSMIEEVKSNIRSKEKDLLSKINPLYSIIASAVCILLENPYLNKASFLVDSQDKIFRQWKNISVLATPLNSTYLTISKQIAGWGLFGLDCMHWRWSGVSQILLKMISQPFNLSVDKWIKGFEQIGFDEKKVVINVLPKIDILFEGITFLAINGCTLGFNQPTLYRAGLSYGLGIAAVYLVEKSISQIYIYIYGDVDAATSYPFVNGITKMATFPLAIRYLLPYFLRQNVPYSGYIFENPKACESNKALCQKEGCKYLGLPERPTKIQFKKRCNELVLQFHPDKHPEGNQKYPLIVAARAACSMP